MQTAHSEDWRPGFAKRAENFPAVCAAAETWRWQPGETIARVAAAVLKGTPSLSIPQRMTLLLYVEHLNQDRLEQDTACVWPSTGLVAEYLGCSESQARANRKALEAAGYLVRDYTRANRPAGAEAYDLRPLMARLEELEGVDGAIREGVAARRAAYSETVAFPMKYSARAPESRHLEQSQNNLMSSVRKTDAATPRSHSKARPSSSPAGGDANGSSTKRQRNGEDRAIGSPGGASGLDGAKPDGSVYAEMVRQELRTAIRVCPRLAPLVRDAVLANPTSAAPEDAARVAAAAAEFLPQPERNNDQTAIWGWRKHGIRIVTMMAIALEDPEVRSACSYFGKLATQERGASDLRLNLARILRQKGDLPPAEDPAVAIEPELPPLMFAPGAEEAPWPEINAELRRLIKDGAHGSWFNRVGYHGIDDGVISLSTPTGLAADRIKRDYVEAIKQAAETVGVFVERVMISVRKR
ncbi:MAG: DnaA N-terminal domain-containing protein [Phenylobacterium sp.]|uniref:DnaA N-terminal domain-containing protein n=1 Tax=Phenylobacterium sp. TaxID=1871053 RepID=UPI003BB74404